MAYTRLSRPGVTWGLGYNGAFNNPAAPTVAELNSTTLVSLFSCALTEDSTSLALGDSDTDDTLTFCDSGQVTNLTFANPTAQWTGLLDANTGGSGSTVDLTSLYNKLEAWLMGPDTPYWVIQRIGNYAQDSAFAVGQRISMAAFKTDYPIWVLDSSGQERIQQNFLYDGSGYAGVSYNFNYTIAS